MLWPVLISVSIHIPLHLPADISLAHPLTLQYHVIALQPDHPTIPAQVSAPTDVLFSYLLPQRHATPLLTNPSIQFSTTPPSPPMMYYNEFMAFCIFAHFHAFAFLRTPAVNSDIHVIVFWLSIACMRKRYLARIGEWANGRVWLWLWLWLECNYGVDVFVHMGW